jgi:transketolase
VTLIAVGVLVKAALDAAELLAADGIDCRVLNAASLKPADAEAVLAAAAETGAIVTAEDHQVHGGLGSVVAQITARQRPVPMAFVGMQDRYGTSGRWDELLQYFDLTPQAIAQAAREALARKGA